MGQCQSLPKGPRRRGPQGKPAQQGSPPWVRSQIRGDGVKSVVTEQRYRPAEHGSKPIPVYDARDYGDDVDEILPR